MSALPSWPAELRRRLYKAAAKNAETVPNPVTISIKYPKEDIIIRDVDGSLRTVSVPACSIVMTSDRLTPSLVADEPTSSSSGSSQTRDSSAPLYHHEIVMPLEGAGTEQVDGYVDPAGGFALPTNTPAPVIGSVNSDVRNAPPQYPVCHRCASTTSVCEGTAGFPCRGCIDSNLPCVVTFYPQAAAEAYGGFVVPESVGGLY
ncbi:hypothetical protein K466DRAFT_602861 [Polyporus arcularius HHB13444]|uniref:Uncharacterized protein n=1 Tax=Polyporus arcularius HHB13444 TaxID=1314778 RepID=A0A5C3PC61_9APHY|nr:hypothetical protein K466DRAFT_602861 [Polyporus arcularius HHB13444]